MAVYLAHAEAPSAFDGFEDVERSRDGRELVARRDKLDGLERTGGGECREGKKVVDGESCS